jgi:CRISPR-associated endonuclease/helicase Cas3
MDFEQFFKTATGIETGPFDYQCRLACGEQKQDEPVAEWLSHGTDCQSKLIDIPTGLGKTAAVVLAWLWNRVVLPSLNSEWPRRLVYCLPMRTLVEQTRDEVKRWLSSIAKEYPNNSLNWLAENSPVILMGGEDKTDWDLYPEREAILIGTQDMLLSRALNRGYGMSRYRWPMHFGLLNNDALWVMDETQLMGSGLWTSAQIDWMREQRFKPLFPVKTWWMSATLGRSFLRTSDRQREKMPDLPTVSLSAEEIKSLSILNARRPVETLVFRGVQKKEQEAVLQEVARLVAQRHIAGTLSMIVCNRVAYAQSLHALIEAAPPESRPRVVLLHSRFRPADRQETLDTVLAFEAARKKSEAHPGLVLVATQVVEAGFDLSSTRLWTQLAPWPSLIQRLGRLNRDSKSNADAQAFIFEIPGDTSDTLPYEKSDIDSARKIAAEMAKLCAAEPDRSIRELLAKLATGPVSNLVPEALEPKLEPYPRAMDLHGLFSTEPDVFGGFTDVSPWVRNTKASADVTVFWRAFEDGGKAANPEEDEGPPFIRDEGCPVAVFRLKNFLGPTRHAYQWNPKSQRWESISPNDIRPGMTLMLPGSAGGYDRTSGWTGTKGGDLGELPPPGPFSQRDDEDRESEIDTGWVTLETHLADSEKFAREIADALELNADDELRRGLIRAAALHDIGKSLHRWQEKLLELHGALGSKMAETLWAKAPKVKRPFRPGLRHEAASALAMWNRYYVENAADFPALAIYLVAAHHGKARTVLAARLSVAGPNVCGIPKPNGSGENLALLPWPPDWKMDFAAAEDGASGEFTDDGHFVFRAPGWSGLVADLLGGWEKDAPARSCGAVPANERAALGPFALAYLETLLRAADGRASDAPSRTQAL